MQSAGLTRDDLAAAIDPIAQQRQEAISAAVNPIQEQIEALRGEIPQQVDTEALRQQITDEIMANLPQQETAPAQTTTTPPATTTPMVEPEGDIYADLGPSSSEAAGFNPYGGGDAMPRGGSLRAQGMLGYQRPSQPDPRPMQQTNQTPTVRDTVAVPVMQGDLIMGETGPFIPNMRDILRGVDIKGVGV